MIQTFSEHQNAAARSGNRIKKLMRATFIMQSLRKSKGLAAGDWG
jgi:hypothetical protein